MTRETIFTNMLMEVSLIKAFTDIDNEELSSRMLIKEEMRCTKDPYRNKVSLTPGGPGDSYGQLREYHWLYLEGLLVPDLDF